MGTTAEKLTYLNDTKSLLKDSINSLGGEITSQTTFRQYATELDSIYSKLPKVSGTGSILSLTPTLKGRLTSTLKGNTLQNGTPTPDSPVAIQSVTGLQKITVCGKNLINTVGYNKGTNASGTITTNVNYLGIDDYVKVEPNTTYAITFQDDVSGATLFLSSKDKNGDFIERINLSNARTFTTGANAYYVFFYLYKNGTTFNTGGYVQLEYGSTATTYEAYTSQTKELNLGKNLLNESLISNTNRGLTWSYANEKININGTTTSTYSQSNKINLTLSAGTYVFSKSTTSNASFGIWLYNKNNTLIATGTPNNAITINEEVKSFALYVENLTSNTQYDIDINVMLEKGSNASSYSPYFTPIELNKIDTYQDYISGTPDNWVINRQIGKVVLNGSETGWQYNNNFYYILISNIIYGNIQFSTGRTLCDDYTDYGITLWQDSSKTIPYGYLVNNGSIFIRNVDITSLENFKTYLSSHNIELVYQLETETTETITNQEIINQLNDLYYANSYNGTTNITITSEDLALIMNASALKGEE
jgi:hypothetical protein